MDANTIIKLDFSTIGSIAAIVIALCALGISIWQGFETRRNYRLSVTPNIDILGKWTKDDGFQGIILSNKGLGPAIIIKIEIEIDKHHTYNLLSSQEFGEFFGELGIRLLGLGILKISRHMYEYGDMISAGEKIPFIWLDVNDKNTTEKIASFQAIISTINIRIGYQSIYGDNFSTNKINVGNPD